MKIIILLISVFISACTATVSKTELITKLENKLNNNNAHINIIWYKGTKDNIHYLSHVYSMVGTDKYKVSAKQLKITKKHIYPLTNNSSKWKRISQIGDYWKASRKNNGIWQREPEGIAVHE